MSFPSPDPHNYGHLVAEHSAFQRLLEKIDQILLQRNGTVAEAGDLLAQLGDRLVRQFSMEEESGYFADALIHAPQLISRANELVAQHPKMRAQADGLVVEIAGADAEQQWWQETRKRFEAFRQELLKHEQGEDRLLQEAYNRDLGSHD